MESPQRITMTPETDQEKVDINAVLKKAFEILDQQLRVRGIEVVWDLEQELPLVMADSNRLEQVFINLLINARDAIDEKWQNQSHQPGDKKIGLKTSSYPQEVIVEISDTGMGIADELVDRIFEPFFTTKKVGQGTGLGLSISYGIVQECKGHIQAVSHKGQGAAFIIKFPIATEN
jgi:histidine kinase